nr:hypothetical protein [Tanacetum cinerariifolium]
MPGPEEPEQAPPSPVYIPYVPDSVYPEYIPPEDDVFPADEQPLPAAASPTAESPGYIPESNPDEDPEEDDDEDPEEDPADYPADHDDDDEEEEHPASADSIPPPPALSPPPILPIPLPAASPPLQLLSFDRRADRPEVALPPRKRLSIVHCLRYKAGESSVAAAARPIEGHRADYGFVDSKAAPKRTTRLNPGATSNPNQAPSTTTTTITNAQLQAMIDQGGNVALATRDANRTGDDSHTSRTELKRKMADKYCPRNEMKKIEIEFWNLEAQGTDVT